jgi:hypothetical protein
VTSILICAFLGADDQLGYPFFALWRAALTACNPGRWVYRIFTQPAKKMHTSDPDARFQHFRLNSRRQTAFSPAKNCVSFTLKHEFLLPILMWWQRLIYGVAVVWDPTFSEFLKCF